MHFATPLVPATLIRRYKRFLADMELADGTQITAHCANPGSMMGLAKLKYGWRLVDHDNGQFTGVDTSVPNRALKAALMAQQVPGLPPYEMVRPEVKYGENSRIDFLLSGAQDIYVEVKSVTLSRQPGIAEFPDSVTARGAKHLAELAEMCRQGHRAMMLYLVQRTDAQRVTLAADIDPTYAQAFAAATDAGVEVLALGTRITPDAIEIAQELPFSA